MKQNRLILLISLFITLGCTYQIKAQQRWSIGPRLGANISKLNGSPYDNSFLPGFTGGLYVMYSDVSHFGVSGDVLYSQKGAKFDYTLNNVRYTYNQRLNYIDIPVMARYFMNLEGKVRPNVFAGGVASFLLNAKTKKFTENGQSLDDLENSERFKSVDFSFVAGIGMNFKIAKARWIQADIRYQQSLIPIEATLANGSKPTTKTFNTSINLLFSYAIGVGKKYKK